MKGSLETIQRDIRMGDIVEFDKHLQEILICSCHSLEHQIIFRSIEKGEVYMTTHLTSGNFWRRLKRGIKYIFGYKCRYGQWDEIILDDSHKVTLQKVVDQL